MADTSVSPLVLPPTLSEGISTLLAFPLVAQSRALGVLTVVTRRPRTYSADDVGFVGAAGAELASAIEHALVLREQLERIGRQQLLLDAAETINRSVDSASLEPIILAEAARLMDAPQAALLAVRGDVLVAKAGAWAR